MLNRATLDSTYAHLQEYQARLTTLIAALAAFLEEVPSTVAATTEAAAPTAGGVLGRAIVGVTSTGTTTPFTAQTVTAAAAVTGQSTRQTTRATPKTPEAASKASSTLQDTRAGILAELARKNVALRPSDLVETTGVSVTTFRKALPALEEAGHITVTGATISRRVTLTDRGRAALASPTTARPAPADADLVAARDKAIKDRLKAGAATFAELLAAMPGTFVSPDAKAAACKASLRRLSLRGDVLDAGDKFKLRAA